MKVLIACEESQAVCIAFRELGHEAHSCDLLPCSGGHSEWHIQGDALDSVQRFDGDLVISFQPCTDLAVSGARWFDKKRLSGEQEASIEFFFNIWFYSDCSENPIGIMGGGEYIKKWFPKLHAKMIDNDFPFKPTQIIQPWQFGHGETKATCLWLHDNSVYYKRKKLQPLKPTNIVSGREQRIWKLPPTQDRASLRSKTYPGIAQAMAQQWGGLL